jgi:hypothetical protein
MSVSALNKALNYGWGISDLGFDLIGIAIISIVYFIIGQLFFSRRHMKIRG